MAKKSADVKTTVSANYPRQTFEVRTASGEISKSRGVDPKDAAVTVEITSPTGSTVKTQKVVDAVVEYIIKDAAEKAAAEEKEISAQVIRAFAVAVRDANATQGDYQKTLRVVGRKVKSTQYAVDASAKDAFSVPSKSEDVEAIRKALGNTVFEQLFEKQTSISIKKEVMESDTLRKDLSRILFEALGAEGMKKYFEKDDVWAVKDGVSERIYKFNAKEREAFLKAVKQHSDALKDASEVVPS